VALYQERLYYIVIRIVLNHEDARDVVQESFIKAYRNIGSFNEEYRFYTWLYRIAVNTALNHIQQRRHREESLDKIQEEKRFDPPADHDVNETFSRVEVLERVKRLLSVVPPEMRTVFTLRIYEGMTYQEIAETLDISIGTVMSRLHRARSTLRRHMEKAGWLQDGT